MIALLSGVLRKLINDRVDVHAGPDRDQYYGIPRLYGLVLHFSLQNEIEHNGYCGH